MYHNTDNNVNTQIFTTKGDFQIWNKPSNAKFINIFCLGSGAGGGNGMTGTATTARRGGGGGGSGAYSIGSFIAALLPDMLYVFVGKGGAGGAAGTTANNGSAGALSYISVQPNNTAINIVLQSGLAVPTAGNSGTNSGTAGTGGTAWTGSILNDLGLVTVSAGTNGGAGAISVLATDITPANIVCGGPSGGNTSTAVAFKGGSIIGSGFLNTLDGGALGSGATAGGNGSDGYISNLINLANRSQPIFFTAGSGGGASVSGLGGDAGNSGFGCGGAGGGAGFTGLGGGKGGNGGDGLIIITAW